MIDNHALPWSELSLSVWKIVESFSFLLTNMLQALHAAQILLQIDTEALE